LITDSSPGLLRLQLCHFEEDRLEGRRKELATTHAFNYRRDVFRPITKVVFALAELFPRDSGFCLALKIPSRIRCGVPRIAPLVLADAIAVQCPDDIWRIGRSGGDLSGGLTVFVTTVVLFAVCDSLAQPASANDGHARSEDSDPRTPDRAYSPHENWTRLRLPCLHVTVALRLFQTRVQTKPFVRTVCG
jgi:hypothetical protein